jgi:hypothetical protein
MLPGSGLVSIDDMDMLALYFHLSNEIITLCPRSDSSVVFASAQSRRRFSELIEGCLKQG